MLFSWVFVGASLPHRCLLPNELPFPNETFQPLVQVIFPHFARDLELLKGLKSQADGLRADECRLTNISTGVHTECPHGWLYDRQVIRSSCEDFKIFSWSSKQQPFQGWDLWLGCVRLEPGLQQVSILEPYYYLLRTKKTIPGNLTWEKEIKVSWAKNSSLICFCPGRVFLPALVQHLWQVLITTSFYIQEQYNLCS